MFTLRNLGGRLQFFDIEGGRSESFDDSKKRLEAVNTAEQKRIIEEMMGRSREAQKAGIRHQ